MKIKFFATILIALVLTSCNSQNTSGVKNISAIEMEKLMVQEGIEVIDVRTPGEVSEVYITEADYFFDVNSTTFTENISNLDKSATYIVYCRSGARSSSAANYMVKNGFTNVYNLSGGVLAWQNSKYLSKK
jgi:rhodanese-related sulfurtransferase